MLCLDLKNVFFGKIHWAPSEILEVAEAIFEVAEAKIWISSIFDEFSFRIFTVLSFEVVWPQRPRRPQKGPSEFFQKLHFWNQCVQTKKMRYVTTLSSTFSLNLPTEEVCKLICPVRSSHTKIIPGLYMWNMHLICHILDMICCWSRQWTHNRSQSWIGSHFAY